MPDRWHVQRAGLRADFERFLVVLALGLLLALLVVLF